MAAHYTKGEWTLNFLIGGCLVDTGFLMGEETQGHGTVEGAEEVAPHFYHPFMFLGPKVQLVVFCFDALVCKVADAVAKG